MNRFSVFSVAVILLLVLASCSPSDRQRLDTALSGDCASKVSALDRLLPELRDTAIRQEAEKALVVCRTEIDREKVISLFEDPEKNLDELLKLQSELKATGRAGLLENAYSGFISRLFAEGQLDLAVRLNDLFLKRGLVHATNTTFARAFINCKHAACYPLSKTVFAKMLSQKDFPLVRAEIYHIWLEVVSRYGTVEELEEATFVLPCIFEKPGQSLMQLSMEYQLKAADKRRNTAMPERKVGNLDCEAFSRKKAGIMAAEAGAPGTAGTEQTEKVK